ncbi:MAG: flagellar basal body rod protein FlgB [Rhodoferax sp.]
MFANLTQSLDFQANALVLRAERQRLIASNIANADTAGYVARDFNFRDALLQSTQSGTSQLNPGARLGLSGASQTSKGHLPLGKLDQSQLSQGLGYAMQSQPSVDGNTVDLDRERATFADNAVRYEATLRFINGRAKTLLSAIQGQ